MKTDRLINNCCRTFLLLLTACWTASAETEGSAPRSGGMDDARRSATLLRDPFWPIGFVPKRVVFEQEAGEPVVQVEAETDWSKAMKHIAIQGVSSRSGSEFFAIINGEVKAAGEKVAVVVDDVQYTWVIESISPPHSVRLRRMTVQ